MQRVFLIRHGESAWNSERRIQGNLDPELGPKGIRQAELLASTLQGRPVAAILSSPLRRALQTAEVLHRALGVPLGTDPDLREMGLGAWEGRTIAEIQAASGDAYARWLEDPVAHPAPGGEDLQAFQRRVVAAVERGRRAVGVHHLVVVTHGGVVKAYLSAVLGLDIRNLFRIQVNNASVSEVRFDEHFARVTRLNDACHLVGLASQDVLTDAGEEPAF